jgi:hypothetical protein
MDVTGFVSVVFTFLTTVAVSTILQSGTVKKSVRGGAPADERLSESDDTTPWSDGDWDENDQNANEEEDWDDVGYINEEGDWVDNYSGRVYHLAPNGTFHDEFGNWFSADGKGPFRLYQLSTKRIPSISIEKTDDAETLQVAISFPPNTGHAFCTEVTAGALIPYDTEDRTSDDPGFDGVAVSYETAYRTKLLDVHDTGDRFFTFVLQTLSAISGDRTIGTLLSPTMSHSWCATVDTGRKVVYIIDSKFERKIVDVWTLVKDVVDRGTRGGLNPLQIGAALAVQEYRLHDFTYENAQTRSTCTLWSTVMNALVVGGVIDDTISKEKLYPMLSDDVIIDSMASVNNSVSTTEGFRSLISKVNSVLKR